jgi:hypothetical protein
VHGLHYVGDKLEVLTRAASWLTITGRRLTTCLHAAGLRYDPRRHRVTATGRLDVQLPYTYLGADDHAGANYTGQPAVNSDYQEDRRQPQASG